MGQRSIRRDLLRRERRDSPSPQMTLKTCSSILSHQKSWLGYRRSRKGRITN